MRGFSKKILISLLTTLVVFITVFATTYAWVGIFTYANTDSFKMNLKVQDLDSNYFLTISSSGKPGTFSSEVPAIDIERQVVNTKYNNKYAEANDDFIHKIYQDTPLSNISTLMKADNTLDDFYAIDLGNKYRVNLIESNDYLKFDLYLSVDTKEGITETTTGIRANVLLNNIEECLMGTQTSYRFLNRNPFKELPSNSIVDVLKELPDVETFNINSKNAVRFSLSIYDPIAIDQEYQDEKPIQTIIYQGGKPYPSYNNEDGYYDLGGILEEQYNTASKELLNIREAYKGEAKYYNKLSETVNNRNDLELIDQNKDLWKKYDHTNYLGCMDGILTKMKITVHLWFEGWDSDCIKAIEKQPVTLNLAFTSGTDD